MNKPIADRDTEKNFITLMLLAPEYTTDVAWLRPEAFYTLEAREIWQKLLDCHRRNELPNPFDFDAKFSPLSPPPIVREHAMNYARAISVHSIARKSLTRASDIAKSAYALDVDNLKRLLLDTIDIFDTGAFLFKTAADVAVELRELINDPLKLDAKIKPLCLGANSIKRGALDRALGGGIEEGDNVVIAGRAGMGKTAVMCQISDEVSTRGDVVAVFSQEMLCLQWLTRLACRAARVNWDTYKSGEARNADTTARLNQALDKLQQRQNLIMFDPARRTSDDVFYLCEQIKRQYKTLDWVIADHLRLFSDENQNEVLRLGKISWNFKQIATNFKTRSIVAAQINRGVETRSNKRPTLADIRQSGEIEENADIVVGLYRDSYYDRNSSDKTTLFDVLKNRKGSTGTAKMIYIEHHTSFEAIAHGYDSQN